MFPSTLRRATGFLDPVEREPHHAPATPARAPRGPHPCAHAAPPFRLDRSPAPRPPPRGLSLEEIALLLFLHLAADKAGCSFWADATVATKLGLREGDVSQARTRLVAKGLVAYRSPLSQLLPLEDPRA